MKSSHLLAAMAIGIGLAGVLAAAPAVVHAQNVSSGQTRGSVAFVRDAGSAGLFEVQGACLALERSQNVGVRGYALRRSRMQPRCATPTRWQGDPGELWWDLSRFLKRKPELRASLFRFT